MFDLPGDLVEEIFSRILTTSIRELRVTCKRGKTVCNDFMLDKATKHYSVLMLRNFRVYSLSVNLNEIHNPSLGFTSNLRRSVNESDQVRISQVFHCNGILLCCTTTREANKTKLVVVNPCTGHTRWIEPIVSQNRYALGYANKSYQSYKILRFPFDSNELEIFELKSSSWRVIAKIPCSDYEYTFGRGVSLKGNAYWISCVSKFDILSFDFTRERFRRLCLPFQKLDLNTVALSDVREEKISILHGRLDAQKMEIWVSNKIDDDETVFSWSNSYTLDLPSQFDRIFLSLLSFLIDEEKKVVVCCGNNNRIYIVGKHGCRKFDYDREQSYHFRPYLFSYVPSLVSLNPPM